MDKERYRWYVVKGRRRPENQVSRIPLGRGKIMDWLLVAIGSSLTLFGIMLAESLHVIPQVSLLTHIVMVATTGLLFLLHYYQKPT